MFEPENSSPGIAAAQGDDGTPATELGPVGPARHSSHTKGDSGSPGPAPWAWEIDPENPYNWRRWKKNLQLLMISCVAFTASVGTSIISPAHGQLMDEFHVSSTVAFLPITTYVMALGLGPVLGGPLSETAGRKAVWYMAAFLGGLFALSCGLVHNFAGLCILRFLSGFFYGPGLAVGAGVLAEVYLPLDRGGPASVYTLSPFLGPGLGPVLGVFLVSRKSWRWTQFVLAAFSAVSLVLVFFAAETYQPKIQRWRSKQLGLDVIEKPPFAVTVKEFTTITILRPLHMLVTEPIVAFLSLYVAFVFGILFMFFGVFFWIFQSTYHFTLEQSGLVFLAVAVGCVIGIVIVGFCTKLYYEREARNYPPHEAPPEYRLLPAMVGSGLLPVSLIWFAFTAQKSVSAGWPIAAIVVFGAGNICLFVSALQYMGDVYHRTNVASAASANAFARYMLAAVFPLFSLQMYQNLQVKWATLVLTFIAIAMLPLPFALFRYGKLLRGRSSYPTAAY
ncbi:hypothetical protein SLS62_004124 [Diatrype stigma]|uniref:Major facilitator superfamily (MFS) profile domain-containing protein n=1 Tax=Diatrype stigma TaxID=117547 RepID=A0AAN9YU44_9PEZI